MGRNRTAAYGGLLNDTWPPMDSETHPPTKTGKEILVRLPPHALRPFCQTEQNA